MSLSAKTAETATRKHVTGHPKAKHAAPPKLVLFKQELAKLHKDVLLPEKASKLTQHLANQVDVLHQAVLGLADTVMEELGAFRSETSKWTSDRDEWLRSMRSVRQEVNDKLLCMEQEQAKAQAELQGARAEMQMLIEQEQGMAEAELQVTRPEMQASVGRALEQLEQRARSLDQQLLDTRCDVQVLRNQVSDRQVLTSDDFPAAVVRQRLQDKSSIEALVAEVARDVAPAAIRAAVQQEAPSAVRDQVQQVLREVVENRTEPFRRQVSAQVQEAAEGVEKLSVEVAQLSGELQALQGRCTGLETSTSGSELRLSLLESQEESFPRGLLAGMNERVEVMAAQQARYARSMEEVVRALVDDASQLARQAQVHDSALQQQRHHLTDTREAVLRCATVFSQVLKIPPPIPTSTLAAPLSPQVQASSLSQQAVPHGWGLAAEPSGRASAQTTGLSPQAQASSLSQQAMPQQWGLAAKPSERASALTPQAHTLPLNQPALARARNPAAAAAAAAAAAEPSGRIRAEAMPQKYAGGLKGMDQLGTGGYALRSGAGTEMKDGYGGGMHDDLGGSQLWRSFQPGAKVQDVERQGGLGSLVRDMEELGL